MCVRLAYGNDYLEILNFCHYSAEEKRGNPYNTTFDLVVQSGEFRGVASCEYDIHSFVDVVKDFHKLYNFEISTVCLDDICYGSKVDFAMDRAGHIEISGKIFGEAMRHSMEFIFIADQTVLRQFIDGLDDLLCQNLPQW